MEPNETVPQPVRPWERTATIVVYALAVLAFAYLGYAWMTQRKFHALVTQLLSGDASASAAAADTLAATGDSLPYLTDALLNAPRPEHRALAAGTILKRLNSRMKLLQTLEDREEIRRRLRGGLNLEAVTRALCDESPDVRAAAAAVVALTGVREDYQRNRLDEMREFEGLLKRLDSADEAERKAAAEAFRAAGERGLPYLAGTAFSLDADARRRGLEALRASVMEILKSSNQRRITPLLERRRCRLLLAGLPRLDAADRALVTDVLNVSGRLDAAFFDDVIRAWPSLDEAAREKLLAERVEFIESVERLRGGESEKIEGLHGKTGAN